MDFADCNDDDWDRDDNDDDVPMPPTRSGDTHMPDRSSSPRPYNTTGLNDDDLYFADHNVYRSYDLGRTHFEDVLGYAFLKDANAYFHGQANGEWALETEGGMKQLCRNLYYEAPDNSSPENNNNNGSGVTLKPFICRWLSDPRRKEYRNVTMDPSETNPEFKQVWHPYAAAALENIDDPEEVQRRAEFFVGHIRMLMAYNEEYTRFFVLWLAFILQRPGLKTQVAILLYGDHGIGKNAPFNWFAEHVLGYRHYYQTATMSDLVGEYAIALKGKRLCLFDEVSFQDSRAAIHKLKNLITNSTANYNPKYSKQFTMRCLVNLLFTTNSSNAIQLQPTERRFVVFECSSEKKQNTQYFTELHRNLNSQRTARAVYQYLMAIDLSHVGNDLQAFRPLTDHYYAMRQMNIPWIARWLSYICNYAKEDPNLENVCKPPGLSPKALFKVYKEWLQDNNDDAAKAANSNAFSVELRNLCKKNVPLNIANNMPPRGPWEINGVKCSRTNKNTLYAIIPHSMKIHLKNCDLYVDDCI